ncbi:sensor domain-containing diguanylate cyclase [Aeromonas simiae]|uniref:sensor domain-containing diguanylate cyclase n=1 Tax=Aeromonas simiae TaxID=218936 RepID=UPI0018678604|nr:sensor domain-containing diguanylate cyclase [Aeromonas simiae]
MIKPLEHTLNEIADVIEDKGEFPFSEVETRAKANALLHVSRGLMNISYGSKEGHFSAIPQLGNIEDARQRPWFNTKSIRSAFVFYTPLYPDFFDKSMVLSIAKPIFDAQGSYTGALAADLNLIELSYPYRSMILPLGGTLMVIDRSGHILLNGDTAQIAQTGLNPALISKMNNSSGSITDMEQKQQIFYHSYTNPDWFVVYAVPLSEITQHCLTPMLPTLMFFIMCSLVVVMMWFITHNTQLRVLSDIISSLRFGRENTKGTLENVQREIAEQQQALQSESEKANRDPLTGLWNRGRFDADLQALCEHKVPFALALIDIDHFKQVNDTYGHLLGDEVLKAVSKLGGEALGNSAQIYRYGGEEIAVLLPRNDLDAAVARIERWRCILETRLWRERDLKVTFSAGVTTPNNQEDDDILQRADDLLYRAKEEGRNRTLGA